MIVPLCLYCRHLEAPAPGAGLACAAFPGGVPEAVLRRRPDHVEPMDGDRGLQFEPRDDAPVDLEPVTAADVARMRMRLADRPEPII